MIVISCVNVLTRHCIGAFVNNVKEGYGVYVWPHGEQYEGMWHNGERHGYVLVYHVSILCAYFCLYVCVHVRMQVCMPLLVPNVACIHPCCIAYRHGIHKWSDGVVFEGNFKQHKEHGFGLHATEY